jgi:hypothetical protein
MVRECPMSGDQVRALLAELLSGVVSRRYTFETGKLARLAARRGFTVNTAQLTRLLASELGGAGYVQDGRGRTWEFRLEREVYSGRKLRTIIVARVVGYEGILQQPQRQEA